MSSSVLSDKSYNMTAVYGLKPLPFFHSSREWMGEQEAKTEDDAEKGRMLWEESNSCMFSLPHCLYQWSLYASFRRSCFTQACFYTRRIHPHDAAHFAVRESVLFIIMALKILFMLMYADTERVYKGTQHRCQDVWTATIYNLKLTS